MPDTTINLMWLGNRALLDSSPETNISGPQASQIVGWTAEGSEGIRPVELTGNYYYSNTGDARFHPTYQGSLSAPPSQFSYEDPATGAVGGGITINSFVSASFAITVHDADGNASVIEQTGILVQMSNGDLFFRPSTQTVDDWEGIERISHVEVLSAYVLPLHTYPATIGFNTSIFDVIVVCFARGTLIECADGSRPVEDLRAGDMIVTRDDGLQPLRWIGSKRIDASLLQTFDRMRPVRISAGALGQGLPQRDLYVSQQHRVLISSKIAERMFGEAEVLIAAKHLTDIDGVEIDFSDKAVEYFHLLFDRHQIVCSEGAQTESLFTGPEALKAVDPAARSEILALFPELLAKDGAWEPARHLGKGRKGQQLAKRHAANDRELQQAL